MIARARPGGTRSRLTLLSLVCLLAVPLGAPAPVAGASLSDQIEAARERQQELGRSIARQDSIIKELDRDQASTQAAIEDTKAQLERINTDQALVKQRIEQAIERLARVRARLDQLVDELRQSDWTLDLLTQELASGEEDLRARRQALGQRLTEAYRAESTTLLEQVFTADSFTDVMSQANAYLAYGDQDKQLAQDIASDQQALDALRLRDDLDAPAHRPAAPRHDRGPRADRGPQGRAQGGPAPPRRPRAQDRAHQGGPAGPLRGAGLERTRGATGTARDAGGTGRAPPTDRRVHPPGSGSGIRQVRRAPTRRRRRDLPVARGGYGQRGLRLLVVRVVSAGRRLRALP